jgi:hypothetical protein
MSTVPAPQPRSRPPTTTREQLDELDALLQRMLELPVDASGGDEAARPEEMPETPVAVAVAPAPVAPPEPPAVVETEPAPALPAVARALEAPPPFPSAPPVPPRLVPEARPPLPIFRPADAAPPWLRSLIAVNRLFDRGMSRLGGPGLWLRRPRGRAVLGWTGLLLLAGALGLVLLGWIGWF